jgi:hypothetical protein
LPPGSTGSHRDSRSTQVSHASRHLHVTGRRFGLRSMSVLASALLRAASALPSRSVSPAPCFRALPVRRSPTGASRLLHSLLVCQDSSGFPARPAPTWGSRALPRPAPVEGAPTARFCPVRSVRSSLRSVLCALGSGLCALCSAVWGFRGEGVVLPRALVGLPSLRPASPGGSVAWPFAASRLRASAKGVLRTRFPSR